ncbi:hypothetical protein V4V53_002151 [Vibrio mimicus]
MNVDWKYFSQTKGYKSLKEAYMSDARRSGKEARAMHSKGELYEKFQWVISRCFHYAHVLNKQPWDVLDEWESKRDYWWLNYYQESRQPKIRPESISKKPMHIRGIKKYYKNVRSPDSNTIVNSRIGDHLRKQRTKKPRWTAKRKSLGY